MSFAVYNNKLLCTVDTRRATAHCDPLQNTDHTGVSLTSRAALGPDVRGLRGHPCGFLHGVPQVHGVAGVQPLRLLCVLKGQVVDAGQLLLPSHELILGATHDDTHTADRLCNAR